jgi:hypothetical protein
MRDVNNKIEREVRYYVTSLNYEKVDDFVRAVRGHWGIESAPQAHKREVCYALRTCA